MATPPDFSSGAVLTAAQMDKIGLWAVTPASVSGSGVSLSGSKVTFTGATSVSVNTCFTSSFTNYRLVGSTVGTASNIIQFRVRSGTTDRTNADYAWSRFVIAANNTTGSAGVYGDTYMVVGNYNSNSYSGFGVDIFNPNLAVMTSISGTSNEMAAAMFYSQFLGGISTSNAAYDGFTLIFPSGTVTGSFVLYGYNQL